MFAVVIFVASVTLLAPLCYPLTITPPEVRNLRAAGDTDTLQGRLVLGTGNISTGNYEYVFYVEDSDGYYKLETLPINRTRINEETDTTPRVETYHTVYDCSSEKVSPWVRALVPCLPKPVKTQYVLHVPEGSIIHNMEFDLK